MRPRRTWGTRTPGGLLGVCLFLYLSTLPAQAQSTGRIYFNADTEIGDLSQWTDGGDTPGPGGGIYYITGLANEGDVGLGGEEVSATQEIVHSGNWAVKHDIPNPSIGNHAKFMRWRIDGFDGIVQGYYSAWYYIAEGFVDRSEWKNVMQWKQRGGGPSDPLFLIEPRMYGGIRELALTHWPCIVKKVHCVTFPQYAGSPLKEGFFRQTKPIPVPDDTWFHVEVFYKATATNGEVIVWQDGVEIFNLSDPNLNTLHSDTTSNTEVVWGIGNYISKGSPGRHLLYTDDAIITDYRVGFEKTDTTTPSPPTNLRIIIPE